MQSEPQKPPNIFDGATPEPPPVDIIDWLEENYRCVGSVRSEQFDRNTTPWNVPIIRWQFDRVTQITTYIKPVQCGGSEAGTATVCGWSKWGSGLIQFNWENDKPKAEDKWREHILPRLEACGDLDWRGGRFDAVTGRAEFLRTVVRCQGVFKPTRLDSDSVPRQINEEVHAWPAGHLAKARGRQTAVWNPKALDISNAGMARPKNQKPDGTGSFQLHDAFLDGTQQHWESKCPGCGLYHAMRTRWQDDRPDLGGLRYDSEKCRRTDGSLDYNKLVGTIRFQMPCGYLVHDDVRERRALSLSGRYGEPQNPGAQLIHRSATLEAVSVDFIPWIKLIQEKQTALRALKAGDDQPWRRYLTERECQFYSEDSRPFQGVVILNQTARKSRDGLKDRIARFWWADKQRGYVHKGEMTHYWLVIRDVLANADSQLVWEGLVQTDSDLIARLDDFKCERTAGGVDATWDRNNVLQFCYRNGCHALTVSAQKEYFFHKKEKVHRIWSEPEGLHRLIGQNPKHNYVLQVNADKSVEYVPHKLEPRHWSIHNLGAMKLLFFLRDHKRVVERNNGGKAEPGSFIIFDVPADVSEEYKHHAESWECSIEPTGRSKQRVEQFKQIRQADHMLKCESYIAVLIAMSGILGQRLMQLGVSEAVIGGTEKK